MMTFKGIRRSFAPMIKLIHPDLFATKEASIKRTNLSCLQTLNLIFDNIEDISNRSETYSANQSIEVKNPFYKVYPINCFISSSQSDMEGNNKLRKINMVIRTPPALHQFNHVDINDATDALKNIIGQIDDLAEMMSLPRAFETQATKPRDSSLRDDDDIIPDDDISSQKDEILDSIQRRLSEIHIRQIPTERIYASTHTKRHKDYLMKRDLVKHIDLYLSSGNVLIRNASLIQEFQAMESLKSFFIEFGSSLYFSFECWRSVIIILDSSRSSTSQYAFSVKSGRSIIEIPLTFKHKKLLNFCCDHILPITNVLNDGF